MAPLGRRDGWDTEELRRRWGGLAPLLAPGTSPTPGSAKGGPPGSPDVWVTRAVPFCPGPLTLSLQSH